MEIIPIKNYSSDTKYLEQLVSKSKKIYDNFKKANVFHSKTLAEMFSPAYVNKNPNSNTVLVKSLKTNKPTEIFVKRRQFEKTAKKLYDYGFFNDSEEEIAYKYFYIQNDEKSGLNEMLSGFMTVEANNLYSGLGIREEEMQIKDAIKYNIAEIPRYSLGHATLYHVKMGFLPIQGGLNEIKTIKDIEYHINLLSQKSRDIKLKNFKPILIKKGNSFYIDLNTTQTIANVNEIKQRLTEGCTKQDLKFMDLSCVELKLSGEELEYWKKLIKKTLVN